MSNTNSSKKHTPLHTAEDLLKIWQEERVTLGQKYAHKLVDVKEAAKAEEKSAPKANENILSLLIRVGPRLMAVRRLRLAKKDAAKTKLRLDRLLRHRISGMADALLDPNSIEAARRQSYHEQWADFTKKMESSYSTAESLHAPLHKAMRDSQLQYEQDATHYANKAEVMQIKYFNQEMEIIKAAAAKSPNSAAAKFLTSIKAVNAKNLETLTPPPLNGKPPKALSPNDTPKPTHPIYPFGDVPF